jgi:HlyD family secretion protein
MARPPTKGILVTGLLVLVALGGWAGWRYFTQPGRVLSPVVEYFRGPALPRGFASGNGRIEATEYDVATKRPGRLAAVLVDEGAMVEAGQVVARMDTQDLEADLREAHAQLAQAREDKRRALSAVTQRESDLRRADAAIAQRQSELRRADAAIEQRRSDIQRADAAVTQRQTELQRGDAAIAQREAELALAKRELERLQMLFARDLIAQQQLDEGLTRTRTAEAVVAQERAARRAAEAALLEAQAQRQAAGGALAEARSQRQAADAAVAQEESQKESARAALASARIDVDYREAAIEAAAARVQGITTEIADSTLTSPIPGRVQYRVAQPGEVLGAGGRVLNLVDLSDVHMTFFLPTAAAGRVALGTEIRLVLDAFPQYVVPARASFVADVAQFTPKAVETATEREKLMFRVKAQIPAELLRKHITQVKTGLPGVAYVRLDADTEWPAHLAVKLPQ